MTSELKQDIAVVSVSIDLGAGRRGVDMGPSALRLAGLNQRLESLGYRVREVGTVNARDPEVTTQGESRLRFLNEVTQVCKETYRLVADALDAGCFPLVLGGDHSLSIGSVPAVAAHYRRRGERIGVLWVDAHTDMNTPDTTPSGNIHGMSLAALAGRGPDILTRLMGDPAPAVDPRNICVIAARDIDDEEKEVVRETGIRVFTMTEVDERGIAPCIDEALERLNDGTGGFHLSYDLDGLDPMVAPGVGTPVLGGLTYREGHLVCEKIARSGTMVSLEVVEVNPVLDVRNGTARMAVDLIASALGKAIL
ncbi:MAG TPA: arginase [Longimicrobiales bacterium]|nr:arginase [Longimicrobiales bacterium]